MVEYLKSYNPLNFSNPVVNSGTGYNDFGKYDLCLDAKFKYYLNKITFNTTSDTVVPTFDAYVGLCIPEICYDDTILENWKGFLNKYTGIKKFECTCTIIPQLQDLIFIINNVRFEIPINKMFENYGSSCTLGIEINQDNSKWIFGNTFLNNYLTLFDIENESITF